jgi:hypothetical protein
MKRKVAVKKKPKAKSYTPKRFQGGGLNYNAEGFDMSTWNPAMYNRNQAGNTLGVEALTPPTLTPPKPEDMISKDSMSGINNPAKLAGGASFAGGVPGGSGGSGGGSAAGAAGGLASLAGGLTDNIFPKNEYGATSDGGAIVGGALKGFSAGSSFGPVGMVGGALIGGITGLLGNNKAQKAEEEAKAAEMAQKKAKQQIDSNAILANYDNKGTGITAFKKGGYAGYQQGGVMGGQLNPLSSTATEVQGAQPGMTDDVAIDGGNAFVDHGEVLRDKAMGTEVFSDTLKPPGSKKTFAQLAKRLEKQKDESDPKFEAANDRLDIKLDDLFELQQGMNGDSQGEPAGVAPISGEAPGAGYDPTQNTGEQMFQYGGEYYNEGMREKQMQVPYPGSIKSRKKKFEEGGMMRTEAGTVDPKEIYDYLINEKGLSENKALGMLNNMQHEGELESDSVQWTEDADGNKVRMEWDDPKAGIGLFQHTFGPRKKAFLEEVPNWRTNWKGQIDFAMGEDEMKSYLDSTFENPEAASRHFTKNFENPANASQEAIRRAGEISKLQNRIGIGFPDTSEDNPLQASADNPYGAQVPGITVSPTQEDLEAIETENILAGLRDAELRGQPISNEEIAKDQEQALQSIIGPKAIFNVGKNPKVSDVAAGVMNQFPQATPPAPATPDPYGGGDINTMMMKGLLGQGQGVQVPSATVTAPIQQPSVPGTAQDPNFYNINRPQSTADYATSVMNQFPKAETPTPTDGSLFTGPNVVRGTGNPEDSTVAPVTTEEKTGFSFGDLGINNRTLGDMGMYGENLANMALINRTPAVPTPELARNVNLKRVDAADQLNEARRQGRAARIAAQRGTVSGQGQSAALANILGTQVAQTSNILGQRDRTNVGIANQEAMMNQQTNRFNTGLQNQYEAQKVQRANAMNRSRSQNLSDMFTKGRGLQAEREQRQLDLTKMKLIADADPTNATARAKYMGLITEGLGG